MEQIRKHAVELAKRLDLKKGEDIKVIELAGLSSLADYFILATGLNNRHVISLSDEVKDEGEKNGFNLIGREGRDKGDWVLVDLGDIIVHIFTKESREYYKLDKMWREAKVLDLDL